MVIHIVIHIYIIDHSPIPYCAPVSHSMGIPWYWPHSNQTGDESDEMIENVLSLVESMLGNPWFGPADLARSANACWRSKERWSLAWSWDVLGPLLEG